MDAVSVGKIPRIIHQVWYQFSSDKPATPPAEYDHMRQSWLDMNPGWEVRLWNEADSVAFLQAHFPEMLPVFLNYKKPIMRVDSIRYAILAHYGGVYVDVDTIALQPLEPLLQEKCVLVKDVTYFLGWNNGFMMVPPRHPLMLKCIRNLHLAAWYPNPITATGPIYLTANWLTIQNKKDIRILSVKEAKTYFHHRHDSSWNAAANWTKALDPQRRQYMTIEEVPLILKPFLKGKVGAAL